MSTSVTYGTILENHYFSVNGSAIKYQTRNICADATAKMLEELAKILFPNEEIEIYVIPAQDGCHQDSFWIKHKDSIKVGVIIAIAPTILTLPGQISQIVTDNSTRKLNQSQEELINLQIQQAKLELKKQNIEIMPSDNQLKQVVSSQSIKKAKSQHFSQLQKDTDITKEQIIAKQDGKVVFDKTITSVEFPNYVEDILITTTTKTIEKIHQLTVIKPVNDIQHKDLMWNVEDPNRKEKFSVYMADSDFYNKHLKEVFGLKSLIARVRYTIDSDDDGKIIVRNKEIILVYKYNDVEFRPFPHGEKIYPAPLDFGYIQDDEYVVVSKTQKKKSIIDNSNQYSIYDFM